MFFCLVVRLVYPSLPLTTFFMCVFPKGSRKKFLKGSAIKRGEGEKKPITLFRYKSRLVSANLY